MVKAVLTGKKGFISKNIPKDGFIQKKKNNKSKQTAAGKVALINGSKARNDNKAVKEQNLQKQTSNAYQKPFAKGKNQNKKGGYNNDKQQEIPSQKALNKKKITLVQEKDDTDSEIEEDINEGVVLEDQSMLDESENCEDEEKSNDDESEEEKNVLNILGHSLADESDEDDDDYEAEEEEKKERKNVQSNKGVKMFKGLKQADSSSDSVKTALENSALEETLTDDNDEENDNMEEEEDAEVEGEEGESEEDEEDQTDDNDDDDGTDDEELEEEDCDSNQDEGEDEEEDEDEDEDEQEEEEEEDEADESALGLKALLDNTIADDDEDDEDFVESGENDEDDDISDEEDEEEDEDNTLDNSQQNANTEDKTNTDLEKIKTDKRTIFIGNLPVDVKKQQLNKLFKKFGTIETIRLRGTVAKSLNMPKKVAAITKAVHPQLKSVYAYILYASEKSAKAALVMNGTVFEGNYIRVDGVGKSQNKCDQKRSVFVGNLYFRLEDNKLREHFAQCGEVESVRIIRDSKTGIGKGIGFVKFKTEDAATLALELDGTTLANREIRVKTCTAEGLDKKQKHGKRSHSTDSEQNITNKKSKNNEATAVPVNNKQTVKKVKSKEQQVGKGQASPQQGKTFQGQKADASKKKKKNKLEKKKKILAEKLTAKPKKPSN